MLWPIELISNDKKGKQFFPKAVGTTGYVKEKAFLWKFVSGMCADKSAEHLCTYLPSLVLLHFFSKVCTGISTQKSTHKHTHTNIPMLLSKMINLENEVIQLVSASEYNWFSYGNCYSAPLSSMCKNICMVTKKEPSIRKLFSMIQCHSWAYSREDLYTISY